VYTANSKWYRGSLRCRHCDSVPRERATAFVIAREIPDWRLKSIHESSSANRGVSLKLQRECPGYIGTQFFRAERLGASVRGWRNENLETQTFDDEVFDLVVSLDVTEHVFHPDLVFREIYRTLKPKGLYISTFPIVKRQIEAAVPRAKISCAGDVIHLVAEPQFHGNPVDSKGSLVTFDYGYDIHEAIAGWAPFGVEICRFHDREIGVLGEFTEVIICRKH